MDSIFEEHPDERNLEKYLLGALRQAEADRIEEHLLVCHACVDKASELGDYIRALRKTLDAKETKAPAARRSRARYPL
jgi:anti-sigma factor RsiW